MSERDQRRFERAKELLEAGNFSLDEQVHALTQAMGGAEGAARHYKFALDGVERGSPTHARLVCFYYNLVAEKARQDNRTAEDLDALSDEDLRRIESIPFEPPTGGVKEIPDVPAERGDAGQSGRAAG